MAKNVLVAGGSGFVGRNITISLAGEDYNVVASRNQQRIDGPESDLYHQYDFIKFKDCLAATKHKDICIFSTGISYGAKYRRNNPTAALAPVSAMFHNLMEASARNQVPRIIILSTATIYQPSTKPLAEHELDLKTPPHSAYTGIGAQFRYFEQIADYYAKIYGIEIDVLRISSLFGPFDKFDGSGSILPSLIARAVNDGPTIQLECSPQLTRDFFYIKDFCQDLIQLMNDEKIGSIYNMGSGSATTMNELVDCLMEVIPSIRVYFKKSIDDTADYRCINIEKLQSTLGNLSRTPLKYALSKTVDWYRSNMSLKPKIGKNRRVFL